MISLLIIIGILIVFVCTISMCKIAKKTMPSVVYDTQQKRVTKRPLQNVQFCSSSRKAKILTTGIYLDISRIKIGAWRRNWAKWDVMQRSQVSRSWTKVQSMPLNLIRQYLSLSNGINPLSLFKKGLIEIEIQPEVISFHLNYYWTVFDSSK